MNIVPYEGRHAADWDRLVASARNATFLHSRSFMDYHADRFEDASLLCVDGDKLVAVLPASRHGERVVSHGGLTYGGLLMPESCAQLECLAAFSAVADHYRARGVQSVVYKAVPHVFHRSPVEEDLFALTRLGARIVRRDVSSVLALDARVPYSKGRKWSVNKAKKSPQTIGESGDFAAFHALLAESLARHGTTPVHSVAELELLHGRFPEQIRLFCARVGDELGAAALMFDCGGAVHTQYLTTSELGRELCSLDLLLDHLITREYVGRRWFSFGISTSDGGTLLNEGLLRQKEGFGARSVMHDFYEWTL